MLPSRSSAGPALPPVMPDGDVPPNVLRPSSSWRNVRRALTMNVSPFGTNVITQTMAAQFGEPGERVVNLLRQASSGSVGLGAESESTLTCNICFETCEEPVVGQNCGHASCRECLRPWVLDHQKNECPSCRATLFKSRRRDKKKEAPVYLDPRGDALDRFLRASPPRHTLTLT